MVNSNDSLTTNIPADSAQESAETLRRERQRDNDRLLRDTSNDAANLNLLAFLMALFFDKDADILKNDDAINKISNAFSLDSDAFKSTISDFRNGSISGSQAASQTRNSISNVSSIDWDQAEEAVSTYAQSGNPLLELLADKESGGDYNRIYGAGHQTRPLTDMTINEVLDWQRSYVNNGSPSSAAGKYQIIQKTLAGLKDEMGLTGNEKYDEAMQDKMAETLLNRRGYDDFLAGNISEEKFMRNVSMEWASAPKDMGGQSYYAGDGLNKAHIEPATMLLAIRHSSEQHNQPQTMLAANFSAAKAAQEPLEESSQANLTTQFDGNGGVDEIAKAAEIDASASLIAMNNDNTATLATAPGA